MYVYELDEIESIPLSLKDTENMRWNRIVRHVFCSQYYSDFSLTRVIGMSKMTPPISDLLPRLTPILKNRHPKVQDVAVFGVPDDRFGETVAAWIKLREGESSSEDEIREFCKGQIAHYKVPAYIRFVDEFPMTVTGKIQKFVMRDGMAKELGLEEAKTA